LLWASPVGASEDIGRALANDAAEMSAASVYNLDVEQLPLLLKHLATAQPNLMGLEIVENIESAIFFQLYRANAALIYGQDLPEAIKKLNTQKADIHYEGEMIGHVVVYYADREPLIELTSEERAWIKQHPSVRVASEIDWPPFEYRDEQGRHKGIAAEILRLVAKKVGLTIEHVYGTWPNLLSQLEAKELELSSALNKTPDREKYLVFTDAWAENSNSIICRQDRKDITSFNDLQDKIIAVEDGYSLHEFYKSNYPNLNLLVVADTTEALRAVSTKKADAYIGAHWSSQYGLQKTNLSDLHVVGFYDESIQKLYMGIRNDYPILRDIIQKGLSDISSPELTEIIHSYISTDIPKSVGVYGLGLTKEEQVWLAKHPSIRVSSEPDYAPMDYRINGEPAGYSVDYVKLLANRLGIELHFVKDTWANLLKKAENKELDLVHTIFNSPAERQEYLNFTQPYKRIINVIAVRDGVTGIEELKDLSSRTVALVKGDSVAQLIPKLVQDAKFIYFDDYTSLLKALSFGKADATVLELPLLAHHVSTLSLTNIKIASELTTLGDRDQQYRLAARKDWPLFIPILEKAMDSLGPGELAQLENKWMWLPDARPTKQSVELTDAERAWLKKNPVIRVSNESDWPPFNYNEGGKPKGYSVAYMNLLAKRLGFEVEFISGATWNEFLEMTKTGGLDVMLNIVETEDRLKYLEFTDPYVANPSVLIVTKDRTSISDIASLAGKTVAIPRGFFYQEIIERDYRDIKLLLLEGQVDCLKAVSFGKADATIGGIADTAFMIRSNVLTNLKVLGEIPGKAFSNDLRLAVPKDMGILRDILQKGISSVTSTDTEPMHKRWIGQVSVDTSERAVPEVSLDDDEGNVWALVLLALCAFAAIAAVVRYGLRAASEELLAIKMGSKQFRNLVILSLLLLVMVVSIFTWISINQNKKRITETVAGNLLAVHVSTVERLEAWAEQRKKVIKKIGQSPELVSAVRELLAVPQNRESLLASEALKKTRNFFQGNEDLFESLGFFIIDKDQLSIGSRRDTNIGTKNLIAEQRPLLLEKAFDGDVVFVPPVHSDVSLTNTDSSQAAEKKPPTMFFAAPVQDENGEVLAVMTLRVDPGAEFTTLLQSGRMGESGESYAFDEDGLMMSRSRFEAELHDLGLLRMGELSMLRLRVTDPGRNLFETNVETVPLDLPLTRMATSAVEKQSGMDLKGYRDYRGVLVCGTWSWLDDLDIGVATEIDYSEAYETYAELRTTIFLVVCVTLILAVGATLFTLFLSERTSKALIKARDRLEDRVKERTAELRQASEEIKKSEQQIRAMSDSSSDSMIMLNSNGEVLFWNAAAEQMFGYTASEALGGDMHKLFVPEEYHPAAYKGLEEFARTGKGLVTEGLREETALRRDGSPFPVELAVSSFKMGGQWYAVGTVRDITERKEAEAALSESEERTRLILSSAGEGIFGVNLKGKVIFINETACSMLQYNQDEIMGQPVHDLIHHTHSNGNHYPVEECPMQKAFTEGISSRIDNEVLWRKDNTNLEVEYSAVPVKRGDEIMGAVISFQDITARRAAEKERDDAHNIITSSIQYASRIQRSILPSIGLMEQAFANYSVLWQPRDVVGGDIYWCKQWGEGTLFILADSTGHGVPGAFMTLIATGALDLALLEVEPGDPGRIISLMHSHIQEELGQHVENGESDDGLELGACYIPADKKSFIYAGARFPLFIIENGEVSLVKGDKKGIGYRGLPVHQEFTNQSIDVIPGRRFFITSDGLIDQVGGPKRRSFGKKRIKNLLLSLSDRPVSNVSNAMLDALKEYQGDEIRRDDLSAIAFEL